jgi:hypothetical protein
MKNTKKATIKDKIMSEFTMYPSPRPVWNEHLQKMHIKEMLKAIQDEGYPDSAGVDYEALEYVFRRKSYVSDGYDLAKEIEEYGVDPDARLVEILDRSFFIGNGLMEDAEKKWIKAYRIKPHLEIGTKVIVKRGGFGGKKEGVITGYREEEAKYLVMIPSEGMTENGSRRALIKYEHTERIEECTDA